MSTARPRTSNRVSIVSPFSRRSLPFKLDSNSTTKVDSIDPFDTSELPFSSLVPNNGLVIYCGTIVTDDGKEKKVNIDFEPFKPINTSLYLCDNKFHTEVNLSDRSPRPSLFVFFRRCKHCSLMILVSGSLWWTAMGLCLALCKAIRVKWSRSSRSICRRNTDEVVKVRCDSLDFEWRNGTTTCARSRKQPFNVSLPMIRWTSVDWFSLV